MVDVSTQPIVSHYAPPIRLRHIIIIFLPSVNYYYYYFIYIPSSKDSGGYTQKLKT